MNVGTTSGMETSSIVSLAARACVKAVFLGMRMSARLWSEKVEEGERHRVEPVKKLAGC